MALYKRFLIIVLVVLMGFLPVGKLGQAEGYTENHGWVTNLGGPIVYTGESGWIQYITDYTVADEDHLSLGGGAGWGVESYDGLMIQGMWYFAANKPEGATINIEHCALTFMYNWQPVGIPANSAQEYDTYKLFDIWAQTRSCVDTDTYMTNLLPKLWANKEGALADNLKVQGSEILSLVSTPSPAEGTKSLQITDNGGAGNIGVYQVKENLPQDAYTFSVYVRKVYNNSSQELFIKEYDGASYIGESVQRFTIPADSNWHRYSVTKVTGAAGRKLLVGMRTPHQSSLIWVTDKWQLEEGTVATSWIKGGPVKVFKITPSYKPAVQELGQNLKVQEYYEGKIFDTDLLWPKIGGGVIDVGPDLHDYLTVYDNHTWVMTLASYHWVGKGTNRRIENKAEIFGAYLTVTYSDNFIETIPILGDEGSFMISKVVTDTGTRNEVKKNDIFRITTVPSATVEVLNVIGAKQISLTTVYVPADGAQPPGKKHYLAPKSGEEFIYTVTPTDFTLNGWYKAFCNGYANDVLVGVSNDPIWFRVYIEGQGGYNPDEVAPPGTPEEGGGLIGWIEDLWKSFVDTLKDLFGPPDAEHLAMLADMGDQAQGKFPFSIVYWGAGVAGELSVQDTTIPTMAFTIPAFFGVPATQLVLPWQEWGGFFAVVREIFAAGIWLGFAFMAISIIKNMWLK